MLLAGFQGRANIAKMLIDHGVNPSSMHKDGFTPVSFEFLHALFVGYQSLTTNIAC